MSLTLERAGTDEDCVEQVGLFMSHWVALSMDEMSLMMAAW
jgi:hypothetical protein